MIKYWQSYGHLKMSQFWFVLNHFSMCTLNCLGCSIIGAWPHSLIQNKVELGRRRLKSCPTSGGVTMSFSPQMIAVGILILGKSLDMLWRIALLAIVRILISFFLCCTQRLVLLCQKFVRFCQWLGLLVWAILSERGKPNSPSWRARNGS